MTPQEGYRVGVDIDAFAHVASFKYPHLGLHLDAACCVPFPCGSVDVLVIPVARHVSYVLFSVLAFHWLPYSAVI